MTDTLEVFLRWLLLASFHGGILIALVLLIRTFCSRWITGRWLYAMWLLVVIRLAMPVLPQSDLSIANIWKPAAAHPLPVTTANTFTGFISPVSSAAKPHGLPLSMPAEQSSHWSPRSTGVYTLFAAWAVGSLFLLFLLVRNALIVRGLARRGKKVSDLSTLRLLDECRELVGVQQGVNITVTDSFDCPALTGVIRPRILISPATLSTTKYQQLRIIICHELVHLRRRDLPVSLFASAVLILHWFNPLLWLALHYMRADRELACDEETLKCLGSDSAADYGRTILSFAESASDSTLSVTYSAVGIIERRSEIKRRITMLSRHSNIPTYKRALGLGLSLTLVTLTFTEARSSEPTTLEPNTSEPAASAVPTVTELAPPREHSKEQPTEASTAVATKSPWPDFSATPFTLTVDERDGEVIYTFDEKTKKLDTVEGKHGVNIAIEGFTITCDYLMIKPTINELFATGTQMLLQEANTKYLADYLAYNMQTGALHLKGNVEVSGQRENGTRWITKTEAMRIERPVGTPLSDFQSLGLTPPKE